MLTIPIVGWDASRPVPWNRLAQGVADLRRDHGGGLRRCSSAAAILSIVAGLLVSGPLYLGFGYVLAKFGYSARRWRSCARHGRASSGRRTARAMSARRRRRRGGRQAAATAGRLRAANAR